MSNRTAPTDTPCKGKTDLFFPALKRTASEVARETQALQICSTCTKKTQCLEYALHHEAHGIWGGTTARSRERLRRQLGITLQQPHQRIEIR